MSEKKVTLYHSPRSRSNKVVTLMCEEPKLLELIGIEHVVTAKKEQHSERFRAINPMGKIPTLKTEEGAVMMESTAIMLHLLERYVPDSTLLPAAGSVGRARVYELAAFSVTAELVLQPGFRQMIPHYVDPAERDLKITQQSCDQFVNEVLPFVRARFVGPYYLGEQFTVADIWLGFLLQWWCLPLWDQHASRTHDDAVLKEYAERLATRPAWIQAQSL